MQIKKLYNRILTKDYTENRGPANVNLGVNTIVLTIQKTFLNSKLFEEKPHVKLL